MAERPRKVLICSCEDTMPLDGKAIERACRGAEVLEGRQFCRAELERVRKAASEGAPVTIACTQEAPLFTEVTAELAGGGAHHFRQYSRDRRLVERRQSGRAQNGGAACRRGGAGAGDPAGLPSTAKA